LDKISNDIYTRRRIIFQNFSGNDEQGKQILSDIKNLGCSYEGANSKLISITVPSTVDFESVVNYLSKQNDLNCGLVN